MSDRTGAELFVDALAEYGVTHVFGNPGTTELPVVHALADSPIEYILGLHEDIAVGMAGGYAQTRRYHAHDEAHHHDAHHDNDAHHHHHHDDLLPLGVANLHLTPGLAHGIGNLYAAKAAGAPLLVTAGNHSTDFRHEEPILSGDLLRLTRQFCKDSQEVLDVSALPTMVRRAVRTALTPPTGPVFLGLPLDTMLAETDASPERLGPIPTAGRGDAGQLDRAADLLVAADSPVLVVGDHVARAGRDAVAAAVEFAEAAGARVHSEILSSEVAFPGDHDQWVSPIPPDEDLAATLLDTDLLVFAGCSTNTTLTRHERPLVSEDTTCIHLTDAVHEIGKNQPADAAVIGDPGFVLEDLATRIRDRLDTQTRTERLDAVRATKGMVEGQLSEMGTGEQADDPRASKAELVDALYETAPEAFVVDEGITAKYAMLARWPLQPEQYISNKGGGLGYGLPATVGAAVAESQCENPRDVLGFVGDGSYCYYPHSLYTAARYDLDLVVTIPDNRNYRILKDNTLDIMGGDESEYDWTDMEFEPPVDIPNNAESHGARGHLIESPDEIAPAVETALESDGPDVLDVLVHD